MIQEALRSSTHAEPSVGSARSARIEGSATAVTISSRPARNTPTPTTASRTYADPRVMTPSVVARAPIPRVASGDLHLDHPFDPVEPTVVRDHQTARCPVRDRQGYPRDLDREEGPLELLRPERRRPPSGRADHDMAVGGAVGRGEDRGQRDTTPGRLQRPARGAVQDRAPFDRPECGELGERQSRLTGRPVDPESPGERIDRGGTLPEECRRWRDATRWQPPRAREPTGPPGQPVRDLTGAEQHDRGDTDR